MEAQIWQANIISFRDSSGQPRYNRRVTARYEILEHPADVGLLARGASLAEMFENAAAGMMEIAVEPDGVTEREQKRIVADAPDREALLVNFLQEVLWLVDGEGWLARRVAVTQISDTRVSATAFGEPRDAARHAMRVIIKAVTYHQLSVRQQSEGQQSESQQSERWRAEVYFDI